MADDTTRSWTQGKSDAALSAATGRQWDAWFAVLNDAGASAWPHPQIAAWLVSEHAVDGWWAQGITVGFEQAIGRRVPGQRADGTFDVAVTRTVNKPLQDALDDLIRVASEALGREPDAVSRGTKMPSARWKLDRAERMLASVAPLKTGAVSCSLTHSKMASPEQREQARARLKVWLARLG
jgi:hypothetical protein